MSRTSLIAVGIMLLTETFAQAHEVRPGLLDLRETQPGSYFLFWKQPFGGEVEVRVAPVIPEPCRLEMRDRRELDPGALMVRGMLACDGGLAGRTLRIAGLESTMADVLLRVHHADGRQESHWLRPAEPSITLGRKISSARRVAGFIVLGFEHILLGADHLLFVLGLLLVVSRRWSLVKTLSAFTLAHSTTLAVATMGVVSVPLAPLNAAVALSILFLGPESVRSWRGESTLTLRHPWVVAFAFGLLHGFGFATGLSAMGLPRSELPLALLLFNVGVELGQLAFVLLIIVLERSFRRLEVRWPLPIRRLPAYAVGTLGAYWTIQRLAVLVVRSSS